MADGPRIVLIETAETLPGLLPFAAWDAIATADVVLVRDVETHPSASHLYFSGVDLAPLAPGQLERSGMDLMQPGSLTDRRLAKGLVDAAEAQGSVVYLLGPDDEGFGQLVGIESARRGGIEVEFVLLTVPPGAELLRLVEVERRLRDPEHGCPWDLEQDHDSLTGYLLEEAYELIDAIDDGDDPDVQEELGDVLLQVVFHAQIAADRRAFTIDDVARGITDKLVRRHPHVFADVEVADADEVKANWDTLKQEEKQRSGPFDGVPANLPGLMLAHELQRAAAKRGFDWRGPSDPTERVHEELDELAGADTDEAREEEIGDLLGAVVGLARHLGVDPEKAMRRAARKFRDRFEHILTVADEQGIDTTDLDRAAWLRLWDEAKAADA